LLTRRRFSCWVLRHRYGELISLEGQGDWAVSGMVDSSIPQSGHLHFEKFFFGLTGSIVRYLVVERRIIHVERDPFEQSCERVSDRKSR
jgi:hypothetical protein